MKRYLVLAALFVLSLLTYIDRVAISSAKAPVAAELALSDKAMGWVFGAFASANAFPYLFALTGGAAAYFIVAALLNLAAMTAWLWMRPPARST